MVKKKKPSKKSAKKPAKATHTPITRKEYLTHLVKVSLAARNGQGGTIDEFFTQQAARIQKELDSLGEKK